MENEKLSFNKRIALTKCEVFNLIQDEDLDKAGNGRSGYYSIKSIMSHLSKTMLKYDIDLDVVMSGKIVTCIWIDCVGEATRVIPIELKPIEEIERLAGMQNIIQSQGAVLTYYRRYAITNLLNLNATDLIENQQPIKPNQPNKQNKPNQPKQPQKQQQPQPNKPNQPKQQPQPIITNTELAEMFKLMKDKNVSIETMKKSFKKQFGHEDSRKLTRNQYLEIMKSLNKIDTKADIKAG